MTFPQSVTCNIIAACAESCEFELPHVTQPGDRVANISLGDSQFFQFGSCRIGLMETNWGRQDFAVLNRNALVFGLTDYLDNDAGQGDLIFETRKSTLAPSQAQLGVVSLPRSHEISDCAKLASLFKKPCPVINP